MRVTFKEVVLRNLITACITAIPKSKQTKEEKKYAFDLSKDDIKKLKGLGSNMGISSNYSDYVGKYLGILLKDDRLMELGGPEDHRFLIDYNVFSVVKVVKDTSSHLFKNGLYIVTSPKNGYLLTLAGSTTSTRVKMEDVEAASEPEITDCVASLNDAQFAAIMRDPIFLPVIQAAMKEELEEIPLVPELKPK